MRTTIRRFWGVGKRNRWAEELGPVAEEVRSTGGEGSGEIGSAWEGGKVLRGDIGDCEDCDEKVARSCCSNSLICFWASYNSAALFSSSSMSICLLSRSVSSRPSRVAFTLFSRLEFSASFFCRSFSKIALTSSDSASVGAALSISGRGGELLKLAPGLIIKK